MKLPGDRVVEIETPQELVVLIERLRTALAAVKANDRDWERGKIAAQWIEFEIGPLLETFDAARVTDEIAQAAIDAANAPQPIRRQIMPINSGNMRIRPETRATIEAAPVRNSFRVARLIVASPIVDRFVIHDIRVGGVSQLDRQMLDPMSGPVSAGHFGADSVYTLDLDVISDERPLSLVVEYTGDDPDGEQFFASALGEEIDPITGLFGAWQQIVSGAYPTGLPAERLDPFRSGSDIVTTPTEEDHE